MTLLPAMMTTITLTTLAVMVPRMYITLMRADAMVQAGDVEHLGILLEEQNGWVKRHFTCGILGLAMVWYMMNNQGGDISSTLTDSVALYVTVTLLLAIVESFIAQKIASKLQVAPVRVKLREVAYRVLRNRSSNRRSRFAR